MAESITRKNIDLDILDYYDGKIKNYVDNKVGTGSLTIDDTLSDTSTNPVQNKVIKQAIDNKADKSKYGDTTINVGRKSGTTVGDYSHAEGIDTTASSDASHAEGQNTTASGAFSHAEGISTTASGYSSHAEGYNTAASGDYSHAGGFNTKALKEAEFAHGKFNQSNEDTIYSIGDGTADDARHNAFEITTTGGKLHDKDIATTDLIPTTLPANGGNADTVDGMHASDFMPINGEVRKYGLIRMNGSDGIRVRHIDGNDTEADGALYLNYNSPNATIYMNGTNVAIHSGNIGSQSVNYATNAGNANTVGGISNGYYLGTLNANGGGHGGGFQLSCQHNVFGDNRFVLQIANRTHEVRVDYATNADTLDGLHASDIITSSKPYVTGTGVPVYSGGSYIVTTNHGFMPSAVMWWTNVSSGSKYEDIHPANSFNNTQFETTSYESSSSTRPVYYIIFK